MMQSEYPQETVCGAARALVEFFKKYGFSQEEAAEISVKAINRVNGGFIAECQLIRKGKSARGRNVKVVL
ncbi:hypothetical protein [Oleidesulfovibrio sp.]|uniref:hypothetical protein n=1 Tax=Oleidesulfovibrio sp. TaxID=2909707 RepID=UPI003A8BEFF4